MLFHAPPWRVAYQERQMPPYVVQGGLAVRPFAPVTIETARVDRLRTVTSVREAAECLLEDWPEKGRGDHYRRAIRACHNAIAGEVTPGSVRHAFIAAAQEAGIFVRAEARKR
jgi:hypothetical protein